jgi:hypothetical protein
MAAENVTEGSTPGVEETTPPPAPTPAPVMVELVDRLLAENANLRLMNAVDKETILQLQMNDASRLRKEAEGKLNEVRVSLEERYNINLATHEIREGDGIVVPRGVNPQILKALLGRVQQ